MKIYPSITTLIDYNEKIKEINALKLEKVCVFFTGLDFKKRKELIEKIKVSAIKEIPFAHLRSDMRENEIDFLINNYNTQIFNMHSQREFPLKYDYSKYKDMICIENNHIPLNKSEIENWAGICFDVSHLENERIVNEKRFNENFKIIKEGNVKCNHISAIKETCCVDEKGFKHYDSHEAEKLSEFNYLKNYNKELFSNFSAIELNNSIDFQLKTIEYIKKLFNE